MNLTNRVYDSLKNYNINQDQTLQFINLMFNKNLAYTNPDGVIFFFRLTEESLESIKIHPEYLTYPNVLEKLMEEKGDNIHFVGLYTQGMKSIRNGMKELIEKESPKSVSWWNQEMNKFNFRRI